MNSLHTQTHRYSGRSYAVLVLALVFALMLPVQQAAAQCVAVFTNDGGNSRWDNVANWTIGGKLGGTGCAFGTIDELMTAMAVNGAGNQGNEVMITAPVMDGSGQPLFPIFDNLVIAPGASFSAPGNVSIRRGGLLQVEGDLNVGGNLQLNLQLGSDPALPTNSQMWVAPGGMVNVTGNLHLNNWSCSGGTLIDIDGTISVGSAVSGNQTCPPGEEPITGDGIFLLTGGCNALADKSSCGDLCLNGVCPGGTLPVRLTAYDARWTAGKVALRWETSNELNNSHYVLSRTVGNHTEAIARVEGNGTTDNTSRYEWLDASAPAGLVYYMLEQFDYNNTRTLLGIREVVVPVNGGQQLKLWPSPVRAGEVVKGEITGTSEAVRGTLRIVSGAGVVCHTSVVSGATFTLQPELQTGLYYVQVQLAGGGLLSAALVVQ